MAIFHGQTVDMHEDFEDALDGSWVETDNDNNIDPNSAAAALAGSAGMLLNLRGDTAGGEDAFLGYDIGSAQTSMSYGIRLKLATSGTDYIFDTLAHSRDQNAMGVFTTKIYLQRTGGVYKIRIRGTAFADITVASATVYWVTVQSVQDDTSTMNVYGTDTVLVDSVTVTGGSGATNDAITLGTDTPLDLDLDFYFDDLVADWTDATFPLLGWDVGGAVAPTGTLFGPFGGPLRGVI